MAELSEKQKQEIAEKSAKDIELTLNLHGMSLATLPKPMQEAFLHVYIAGATMALLQLKEDTPNPNAF